MITLIGMGSGTPGSLTAQGLAALQGADRILGAKRLLATLPEGCTGSPMKSGWAIVSMAL